VKQSPLCGSKRSREGPVEGARRRWESVPRRRAVARWSLPRDFRRLSQQPCMDGGRLLRCVPRSDAFCSHCARPHLLSDLLACLPFVNLESLVRPLGFEPGTRHCTEGQPAVNRRLHNTSSIRSGSQKPRQPLAWLHVGCREGQIPTNAGTAIRKRRSSRTRVQSAWLFQLASGSLAIRASTSSGASFALPTLAGPITYGTISAASARNALEPFMLHQNLQYRIGRNAIGYRSAFSSGESKPDLRELFYPERRPDTK